MNKKSKKINNILIVKLRGIGDAVLLTPSIRALKEKFPNANITVVTSKNGAIILDKNPYINEIVVYDKKKINIPDFLKSLYKLRKKKFDLAINFHASFRSALLVYLSCAKHRIVHNHSGKNYFSNIEIFAKKEQKSIIERDFDCLRAIGIEPSTKETKIYLSQAEFDLGKKLLMIFLQGDCHIFSDRQDVSPTKRGNVTLIVGINPGANRDVKRWKEEKYAELIDKIMEKYKCEVVIFSGQNEEYIGEKINNLTKNKTHLIENLGLREISAIIKQCSLFVGNDNGLFHIALALGIPTITIFGPENPLEWHPYDFLPKGKHIAVSKNLPCVNCGKLSCETNDCIDSITVSEVFSYINQRERYL